MEIVLVALGTLVFGFLLATLLLVPLLGGRYEAKLAERVRTVKEEAGEEAIRHSRATLKGQIGERFAPFTEGFGYEPADARFLGSPVDYIVFDGLSGEQIKGIAFVEVKTGAATLTPYQRQVREAIEAGRVTWRLLQMPG